MKPHRNSIKFGLLILLKNERIEDSVLLLESYLLGVEALMGHLGIEKS